MKFSNLYKSCCLVSLVLTAATFSACKKDGNPNELPDVDASVYDGTIGGYKSADDVFKENLVAHFTFDADYSDKVSKTVPTSTAGDALVDGVKGKALNLTAGYLYYATQFAAFKTDAFKSFTISQWIQYTNNPTKRTQLFQLARPGSLTGNIDININTKVATNLDLTIQPYFSTVGGGRQDNLNANKFPKGGATNWVHLVLSYNGATGRFNIIANGENIGSYSDRGVGNNLFKSNEPSELIIGGNYNLIPGKTVNADVSYGAMTGKIDELRIYNAFLPDAIVKALYQLELAKK